MRPQVGQVINNKYRLIRLVGDGGMGSVYEARHEVLGTTVALKFLHPELSRRSGLVQRFLQEARVSAHIQSPHVVRVSDVDQTPQGLAFMVMEFLEGTTLQTLYEDLYKAGTRLSYNDALEYSVQMLDGLEAAHKANIIHRDLKPDNVMITKGLKGEKLLKLLDFGIAKLRVTGQLDRGLTRPGVIMGTPEYMAPEQAYSADAVDSRADIFSLGVMIFEMIAGRRPVGGDDPHQIAAAYLGGQVSKLADLVPGIDEGLAQAIHRAMAPMAKDRFASVAELRAAIEPAATAARVPSLAASVSSPPPTPAPAKAAVALAGSSPAIGASSEAKSVGMVALAPNAASPEPARAAEVARAVPKTLPPEDEPAAAASPSGPPPGGSTTTGDQTFRGAPVPPEVLAAVARASDPSLQVPVGSGTVSSPPPAFEAMSPAAPAVADASNGQLTNGAVPATESYEPAFNPRPGGTDMGAEHGPGQGFAQTTSPGGPGTPGTAPMTPVYGAPGRTAKRAASGATSLVTILLVASGVAAAVVGGVYFAHEHAKTEDRKDDTPVVTPPPTTPPPPATDPPPPTTNPPVPVPPPTQAKVPPKPTTPPPTGTTKPSTPPTGQPSGTASTPPVIPTTIPPFVIPSVMPTGFPPILPFPPPTAAPPATTSPPPNTTTGGGSTGSGPAPTTTRPRIKIPPLN